MRITIQRLVVLLGLALLSACSPQPSGPHVKIGKPYEVDGKMYYPAYQPEYEEVGMASWYGPGFDGKKTASGEIFDEDEITAAHPTLPMPSIVRVTNLATGQSSLVRVNDRGPFHSNRVIDLSRGAAKKVGLLGPGTAKVRVQYLSEETEAYMKEHNLNYYAMDGLTTSKRRTSWGKSWVSDAQADEGPGAATVTSSAPVQSISSSDLPSPAGYEAKAAPAATNISPLPSTDVTPERIDDPPQATPPPSPIITTEAELSHAWYVQAGAFGMLENAQKLKDKLSPLGPVEVTSMDSRGKMLYRVRIGPIGDETSAKDILNQIHGMGVNDAKLVHQ